MMLRLSNVMETAIVPALAILGRPMDSPEARCMLLAIGLQESDFCYRCQFGNGPARGFFMFEQGGVRGVVNHHSSHEPLRLLCHDRDVNFDVVPIWSALETDDVLAAGVARLLLYTDPHALPELGDEDGARELYQRCWRPGRFRPLDWPRNYADAMREVTG